jgi:heptosyltransferase-2
METALRPPHCLVVAPSWVGDTVMALPVLDALAASERRVSVLARPHLHSLLRLSPAVSGLVERASSTAETIDRMLHGSFEEAILLPNSFRAAWLARRAGIPNRWGYRSDGRSLLLRPAVHRPPRSLHQLRDYDQLLQAMGVAPVLSPPRLPLSPSAREQGREALKTTGVTLGTKAPLIGLFPGAEFGPSKRWRPENFARTAVSLRQLPSGAQPILIAGPNEKTLADSILQLAAQSFPLVGPDLDLAGLAGLLSQLDVLITNDSGPMHLAAAVDTPCVAIFGPTNPQRTSPSGPGHHVLSAARWCSPCFRRRCPLLHHRCMKEISVSHVLEATRKVLTRPSNGTIN